MIRKAMIKPLISSTLRLSTDLATHPTYANSNVTFSPLCLHSMLGLLTAGSTGRTHRQLLSFLGTNNASDLSRFHAGVSDAVLGDGSAYGGPCLQYVSGIGVDDGSSTTVKSLFRDVAELAYKAEARPFPFRSAPEECRNMFNKYAEQSTAGRIKDLLPSGSINTDTRMLLGSALHFNSAWDEKFDSIHNKSKIFHLTDGTTIRTPFMSSHKKQFVSVYDGFKVLRLPYKQGQDQRQFSFYIFLPNTFVGLPSLWKKLSSDPDFLNRHVPTEKFVVNKFRIPKFNIAMNHKFSDVLKDLGLVLLFTMTEDFSEMVDSPEVDRYCVSEIAHKCFVGVNEEGTEAAPESDGCSFTCSVTAGRSIGDFVADRPFVFLVREDTTGVVLFAGHLLNPLLTV